MKMSGNPRLRGVFVSYAPFLSSSPGGVQVCTHEYLEVLRAAGVELNVVGFEADRRLITRVVRRLLSSPYFRPYEPDLTDRLIAVIRESDPDFIFLNQVNLAGLAAKLRPHLRQNARIVLLSHGNEITDLLNLVRLQGQLPLSVKLGRSAAATLGRVLESEMRTRDQVDMAVTLSPFDAEMESWIGVRAVKWLPRAISQSALQWAPEGIRFGYVGTLDHAPNLEGLVLALEQLSNCPVAELSVRVVGSPPRLGQWLESRFPIVTYLGTLNDEALLSEARSWTAFLHPIFGVARGCSTKLAAAIAWQIPIVTTPEGRRGYTWSDGSLMEVNDPTEFAKTCISLTSEKSRDQARSGTVRVALSSPSIEAVAMEMRAFLNMEKVASCSNKPSQFFGSRMTR